MVANNKNNSKKISDVNIRNVSHEFFLDAKGTKIFKVLEDISFKFGKGEFVTIVGHSGCGKSTLLRVIAGLLQPSAGQVLLDGRPIDGPDAKRGMVFQKDAVFPWLTVRKNVEYGLKIRGVAKDELYEKVDKWIKFVGLDGWEKAFPKQLSGGMRKRVDLARIYANEPEVLLMDEPFGALDAQTKANMQEELLRLWESAGTSVLFVTHDLEEAAFLSDKVIIMSANPGRIKEIVPVNLPRPRTEEMRLSSEFLEVKKVLFELLKSTEL